MLTIQEEFATSNYPATSDALQLVHSAYYPNFPISDPLSAAEEDTASAATSGK